MNVVFDRAAHFYDRTRALPSEIEHDLARLLRDETTLSRGSAVLEVGVGTGRIAVPLARQNEYRYVGVDLSRDMMARLRRKARGLPVELVRADAARLPFADSSFDAVVAVHVFHLVGEWQRAIDEAARVLRPGGLLLHGRNQRAAGSTVGRLRKKLERLAETGGSRTARLPFEDVRPQLEWLLGRPTLLTSVSWTNQRTPREVLDEFEQRIWSWTWSLDDGTLRRTAEEGARWAEASFGSLAAPLSETHQFVWEVYARRGS